MCWSTGLPRTSIIGFGSSAVSSRIRVPRPAARITAFSIFIVGRLYRRRYLSSQLRLRASIVARTTRSASAAFLFRDDERRQVRFPNQFAHLSDIFLLDLRPFFQLLVELAAQCLGDFELRLGWFIIARLNHVAKCIETLVQHVRESEVRF